MVLKYADRVFTTLERNGDGGWSTVSVQAMAEAAQERFSVPVAVGVRPVTVEGSFAEWGAEALQIAQESFPVSAESWPSD